MQCAGSRDYKNSLQNFISICSNGKSKSFAKGTKHESGKKCWMTSSLTANAVVVWLRCTFLLLYTQSQFFWHQCTLRSPAFFWWFRPRLAYWTYMSMISNYICYGPYYKCNLLLIAYTQTIPDSKSKSKSLNPRTYIKSDPRHPTNPISFLSNYARR